MKWRSWLAAPIALALGGCDFAPRYAPPSVVDAIEIQGRDGRRRRRFQPAGSGGSASTTGRSTVFKRRWMRRTPISPPPSPPMTRQSRALNAALSAAYPAGRRGPGTSRQQAVGQPAASLRQPADLLRRQPHRRPDVLRDRHLGTGPRSRHSRRTPTPKRAPMRSPTRGSNCMPNSRATTSICAASTTRPSFFRHDRRSIARP